MRRIIREFTLDKIAAVDRPCQEGAVVTLMKRDFSGKERQKLADKGHAMSGGGYPIKSRKDVANAVQSFGRAKNKTETKKHIIRNARRVGAVDLLPDHWNVKKYDTNLDWLAKQFAVFPFTVESQDDDDRAFDFDEAFEEAMECERWCNAKEEIHPYIHALKCSIVSIMTDDQIDFNMRLPEIRNSIQQFINAMEAKFPQLPPALEATVAKRRALTLRKRVVAGRMGLLKARMGKPKTKKAKSGGAEMRVY
jgi:hypothetical protein